MNPRSMKRFLVGAAVAGFAAPSIALADPTCAYVLGHVDSVTVATPAIIIAVPDSSADVQPVRVHLDETEQTIIGYSVRIPGVDRGTEAKTVFVPGISWTIPAIFATIPELSVATGTCVNLGVSTPAIPVYVPESVLNVPGGAVEVPSISLNILGNPVTTPGKVIPLEGKTLIIPEMGTTVPGVEVGTPAESIVVNVNGTVQTARYLAPPTH